MRPQEKSRIAKADAYLRLNEKRDAEIAALTAKIESDVTKIATLQSEVDVVTRSHADLARRLAEAGRENEVLRKALRNVKGAVVGGTFRIGVITENGCASAVVEGPHRDIFEEWWKHHQVAVNEQIAGKSK